jgi:hypothetical protein
VEPSIGSRRASARIEERRPPEERAVGDRRVDPRKVLQYGPAGAEVEMTDFGVAHLPGGQPDRVLGRPQAGMRPATEEAAPDGHLGRGDGVRRGAIADPEPVEDD